MSNRTDPHEFRIVNQWTVDIDTLDSALPCVVVERYTTYTEEVFDHLAGVGGPTGMEWYCGYVQVPSILRTHHLQTYDEFMDRGVSAYGGLTYGPDSAFFIGWDSNHAFPAPRWTDARAARETEQLAAKVAALAADWAERGPDATLVDDDASNAKM